MAKRKAAPRRRRKTATKRPRARVARRASRRTAARRRPARKRPALKAAARKTGTKKTTARGRKVPPRRRVIAMKATRARTRRTAKRKLVKKVAARSIRKSPPRRVVTLAPKPAAPSPKASAPPRVVPPTVARAKAAPSPKRKLIPGLNRQRRTVLDDDDFGLTPPSPPSSLDLDRTASSARSGRRELRERFDQHTETGPAVAGGDVDADWESAYSVGDEVPGGDNQTPDQDIVDDIGRAVGVEYQDNEELKGEKKISDRDKHRWELDPASAEDYGDR